MHQRKHCSVSSRGVCRHTGALSAPITFFSVCHRWRASPLSFSRVPLAGSVQSATPSSRLSTQPHLHGSEAEASSHHRHASGTAAASQHLAEAQTAAPNQSATPGHNNGAHSPEDPAVQRALQWAMEQQQREPGMSMMAESMSSIDFADLTEFSSEEDAHHISTLHSSLDHRPGSSQSKPNYEVLRLDSSGRTRKFYVRRRDLLKEYRLQPRDLRRIDPTIDYTKTSPSITIKENVLLLCLGGVRAIVTAEKALLFEPNNLATKRLVDTIVPHLRQKAAQHDPHHPLATHPLHSAGVDSGLSVSSPVNGAPAIGLANVDAATRRLASASHSEYMARFYSQSNGQGAVRSPPFELELLEGALIGATGRLDAELSAVTSRVQELLNRLPNDINPVSLEELRRVKAALVELEDKADNMRETIEELMDDEDELRELNLSSRPRREERRRQRERDRLERELERAREIREELEGRLEGDDKDPSSRSQSRTGPRGSQGSTLGRGPLRPQPQPPTAAHYVDALGQGYASWTAGSPGHPSRTHSHSHASPSHTHTSQPNDSRAQRIMELRSKFDKERLAELRAKFSWSTTGEGRGGGAAQGSRAPSPGPGRDGGGRGRGGGGVKDRETERSERMERLRAARADADGNNESWLSRLEQQLEGSEEDIQEAQEALEEMVEAEEEEAELEEVEDLLEYYLQRSAGIQSEAERLLQGARDLEESIGISLSARRYEVNRLELTLSIGSFAAALGAMVAGIFGMNMKSMLEMSVASFWGVTGMILVGSVYVFYAIMKYTRQKRIL